MSGRDVRFRTPSRGPRNRAHELIHDSGVGSSSSEQASLGGRPDRRFTAQDVRDQRRSIPALQEALDHANQKVKKYEAKVDDLKEENSLLHKKKREAELDRATLLDKVRNLEEEVAKHERKLESLQEQYDQKRYEYNELLARRTLVTDPVTSDMMSGGSGETSPPLRRTKSKSKRDSGSSQTDRMKERLNRDKEEQASKSTRHRSRRASISVAPNSSIATERYNEPLPSATSSRPSSRQFNHYSTSTMDPVRVSRHESPAYSNVTRARESTTAPTYPSSSIYPGDYIPLPLPKQHNVKNHHHKR
ncbi:hypothetical protein F4778DRAFT_299219 [Xylariomycetidae sp. FL2044]|nr:hypothetical protein F4778DRAFT_299219 [Xylariomycetidae sp. FL2044]